MFIKKLTDRGSKEYFNSKYFSAFYQKIYYNRNKECYQRDEQFQRKTKNF